LRPGEQIVNFFQEFWTGSSHGQGILRSLYSLLLTPLAWMYGAAQSLRRILYGAGMIPSRHLSRKVLSIGGLRVGGTGKTPFTIWLAGRLQDRGCRVVILTRGYGRKRVTGTQIVRNEEIDRWNPLDCGDEPYLIARSLPGMAVVVDADRYRGGRLAEKKLPVDVFVLDDGFQHLRLARDCDIVLLTGEEKTSKVYCLPRGPFREPASALRDAQILVRLEEADSAGEGRPWSPDQRLCTDVPCFRASLQPAGFFHLKDRSRVDSSRLEGADVAAFCGIARPDSFWRTLEQAGLKLVARKSFPDHHRYTQQDSEDLERALSAAQWAVTTEKDASKIARFPWTEGRVLFLRVQLVLEDEERFWACLERICALPANRGQPG